MATSGVIVLTDHIDQYLNGLRRMLRWRRDSDELLAELEDHLREASERLVDRGADPASAPLIAVERLGPQATVARSFARTPSGGIAVPTRFTRAAGPVALVAAGLWALAAMISPIATDLVGPWTQERYLWWSASVVLAAVTTTVVFIGLLRRAAVPVRWVAVVLSTVVLGVTGLVVATWMWSLGAGILAAGAGLALLQVRASGLLLSSMDWLLVAGAPLGSVVPLVMGPFWEDPAIRVVGFAITAAANAIALMRLGNWLRSETIAEFDSTALVD